ncbi:sulfatase-like hydrolase/transferase [Actinopolymorpha sp. B9G3]|uniref:sulfatase-like hydrolase/transferase n=1 Tax=Actinopolymorpha sp. B9G3 TaxID=3158970 RepID=UPI0032D9901A
MTGTNVLILKDDEHGPRIASTAGHPFVQTPNLDRLAARGVVFENAYCPSPLCCPSRSSFISGRPVHEIQAYNNSMVIDRPNYPSYGRLLDEAGVHTVHAGKVDAYRPPHELGFSEMLGADYRADGDGEISREPLALRGDARQRARGVGVVDDPFRADNRRMADALDFLDRSTDLGKPWTMEVNLIAPHFPHRVTQELWDLYAGHDDLPEYDVTATPAQHPYAEDLRKHFGTDVFTEEATRAHRRAYYGRVTWVDRQLGILLDTLERTGQLDRTVVAFTSDHGEMLGLFGMWWKCSMYDDSVRVPLVVAGPGFPSGVRVRTPVSQLDLNAAAFAAVGASRPPDLSGTPLQQVHPDDPDRAVFAEYHGHGTRGSSFMIRQGRWKFLHNARAPHQLFDLDDDPFELRNLATDAPDVVRTLTERLREEFCDPDLEQDRAEAFIQRQLAALGSSGSTPRSRVPTGS